MPRSWKTRSCRSRPGAREAAVFNSGMAAIMTAFFTFARPNSRIVYTTPLYGGTTGLIHKFLEPFGVTRDSRAVRAMRRRSTRPSARRENCCIVFLETPANPTLIMTDIERAAETARKHPDRPVVMVDNTFLGPAFQHPLPLGADICCTPPPSICPASATWWRAWRSPTIRR